jgi:hypothetical protein
MSLHGKGLHFDSGKWVCVCGVSNVNVVPNSSTFYDPPPHYIPTGR